MLRLEGINDPGTLRQAAILLEKTVLQQQKVIAALEAELALEKGSAASQAQLELASLRHQIAFMKKAMYGPKSEKKSDSREESSSSESPKEKPPGHGPRSQPSLPTLEVDHALAEDDRVCDVCDGALREMKGQFEESDEITIVVPKYVLVHHRRQKYRCSCNANVVTSPGQLKLIRGGRYSIEFAVHVAERKYLDHMPLARQVREMERRGLVVDRTTLWDQLAAAADHLEVSYQALHRYVLKSDLIYADETSWRLMGAKEGSSKWWVWGVACDDAVAYRIQPKRSAKAARQLLGEYCGIVMTDGYSAYQKLRRAGPRFDHVQCWSHVRRKYLECEDAFPEESAAALGWIGALFRIEKAVPALGPHATVEQRQERLDLLAELRKEQSHDEIAKLRDWAYEMKPRVLPGSGIGKAINYMLSLWPGLTRFLQDPRIPLTNNHAERVMRGPVIGRKNHYGSRSRKGTRVAALFYTLFESAKLAGVNPHEYVLVALRRAIKNPGTVTLPRDLVAESANC